VVAPSAGCLHCFGAPRSLYPGVRQPGLLESRNGRCSAQGTGRASLEDWAATATAGVHAVTELSDHHREGAALNNLGSALPQTRGPPGPRRLTDAREALEQAAALFVILRAYDDADRVVGFLTSLNGESIAGAGRELAPRR